MSILLPACGGAVVVPLRSAAPVKASPASRPSALEVVTQSSEVSDPLPVSGASVSYGDFASSLRSAVSTAAAPWSAEPWRISLDIIAADAQHEGRKLHVSAGIRATLRSQPGNVYLGQTEAACRDSATVPADRGQEVFRSCWVQLASAIAGWLGSIETTLPADAEPDDPKTLSGAVGASGAVPIESEGESSESSESAGDGEGSD